MYSNMVTSALFYQFHSSICRVMADVGPGLVAQTTTLDPGGSLVTMRTAKQDPRPGNVISKPVGYT